MIVVPIPFENRNDVGSITMPAFMSFDEWKKVDAVLDVYRSINTSKQHRDRIEE